MRVGNLNPIISESSPPIPTPLPPFSLFIATSHAKPRSLEGVNGSKLSVGE